MFNILIKAFGFILVICLGYFLKSKGYCTREYGKFLSTVIMNVTLPCALVSSINNVQINGLLLIALLLGFVANIITNIVGYTVTKGGSKMDQGIGMINMSGYNIGTFTLPFVQSFFPAASIIYVCMFDIGNSLMCLGGTYSAASMVVASNDKTSVGEIVKKLFSSIPFCTYIILFFLSLFHIAIPKQILSVASIPGNANAFLAMLMIGIMLELKLDLSELKTIKTLIISRYTVCSIIAFLVYFLLPVNIVMKKMIVLALFAPVSGVAPVFSARLGSSSPVPAAINSISILISITILTSLILVFA